MIHQEYNRDCLSAFRKLGEKKQLDILISNDAKTNTIESKRSHNEIILKLCILQFCSELSKQSSASSDVRFFEKGI